jgi:hypothetical protein
MRDFARFGVFVLHGGRWGDEQLLERAYVEEMFTSMVPADAPVTRGEDAPMLEGQRTLGGGKTITEVGPGFYSYNWWLNGVDRKGNRLYADGPADLILAGGHGGRRNLWIFPSQDLIVAWNDSRITDHDDSPGNPDTLSNQAVRLAGLNEGRTELASRWFFAFGHQRNQQGAEQIKALIDIAAAHGLNGMVLSSFGLDSVSRWSETDIALLKELVHYSAQRRIEVIPTGFSVGYGGGALGHDINFAAALPTILSLKAQGGKIIPDTSMNLLRNGDLEAHDNHVFAGYAFHDQPGQISFADSTNATVGKSSIRFEGFGATPHGHGRIMQRVTVQSDRSYHFRFQLKTQDLHPVTGIKAVILRDGREVASVHPGVKSTQDWTEVTLDFISTTGGEVGVYAGIWGGESGKFWLDDFQFSESATLSDIVRREGTPLELKSRDREKIFEEGKDFQPIPCLRQLDSVRIPPGSSIREGENLEISCYRIPYVSHSWGRQISLCIPRVLLHPGISDLRRGLL